MMNESRRKEIQRLANRHQTICQSQVNLGRDYQVAGYNLTPEFKTSFDRLIEAETEARADLNAALEGWHEPVYVQPIR